VQAISVGKSFGARRVLDDVSFRVDPGTRLAVVGRNGEGKTTLLRVLAGLIEPDEGSVALGKGSRVALHEQRPERPEGVSVGEYVAEGLADAQEAEAELAALGERMAAGDSDAQVLTAYAAAEARLERVGGYDWRAGLERTMRGLGIDAARAEEPLARLSGGELTRASLARALVSHPDVLLLDEPTNHLDIEAAEWLERALPDLGATVVVVSHDRWFLESVATAVVEIERGRARLYPMGYSRYRRERAAEAERLGAQAARQAAEIARLERFVERWRAGTKARQAQSRAKRLAKIDRIEAPRSRRSLEFGFPKAERSAKVVVEAERLTVMAGDRAVLEDAGVVIERGERVAILGPNGAGKTSLLETLLGARPPGRGRVSIGHRVQIAYFTQHADELPPGRSPVEALLAGSNLNRTQARTLLGGFMFPGEAAEARIDVLSGGERRRLALACLVAGGGNLLALDEPTNHFDAESREALEAAIDAYEGTVLLISHDRALIDAVATRTLSLEDGRVVSREGGYAELIAARAAAARPDAPPAKAARTERPARAERPPRKDAAKTRAGREARKLERRIADLEVELAELEVELARPEVAADPERIGEGGRRHRDLQHEIAWLMREWEQAAEAAETGE